jgi:DNA helicase HerA-like ATPase
LISFLDEKGRPTETERVFVIPPGSQIGPITPEQRKALRDSSLVAGVYEQLLDRESAYEVLKAKGASLGSAAASAAGVAQTAGTPGETNSAGLMGSMSSLLFGTEGPRGGHRDGIAQLVVKSAVRTVGSSIGREIVRGVLGSLLGGGGRRR